MSRLCVVVLLGLMAFPVAKALEIQSDYHTQDMNTNIWNWTGNVAMVEGSYRLHADSLTVEYDDTNQPCIVRATGNPIHASGSIKEEAASVTGEILLYDCENRTAELIGNAGFRRGDYSLDGERIIYDFIQKQIEAQGDERSNVTTRFKSRDN